MQRTIRMFFEDLVFEYNTELASRHALEQVLPELARKWGALETIGEPQVTEDPSGYVSVAWGSVPLDRGRVERDPDTIILVGFSAPTPPVVKAAPVRIAEDKPPAPEPIKPKPEPEPEAQTVPDLQPTEPATDPTPNSAPEPKPEVGETLDLGPLPETAAPVGVPLSLALVGDDGEPMSHKPFRLLVGSETVSGTTGQDGSLYQTILANADLIRLEVDVTPQRTGVWLLRPGPPPPLRDLIGIQSRLNQVGFPLGQLTGDLDPATSQALSDFQVTLGLAEPTGRPDAATMQALAALTGEEVSV